jgi:hypothetical protein
MQTAQKPAVRVSVLVRWAYVDGKYVYRMGQASDPQKEDVYSRWRNAVKKLSDVRLCGMSVLVRF